MDRIIENVRIVLKPLLEYFGVPLSDRNYLVAAAAVMVVFVLILAIVVRVCRGGKRNKTIRKMESAPQKPQADIIVRRKTTSILKRQSLEDVLHNPAYMQIDCAEFCDDSAVRRIYLKNTCVKEIYNMYAEDLRNPETPKEDGCMVLGRWVHDEQSDEYYVSLEEIVKPGDDAVFKEYELNFGGKIKLKVSEKLRKLRRETNLQYDMTCWVHSHPGLGVFFSNADSGVQMQLKHPVHPKFLTAIVVDILTPDQEMGIFTFRHDLTINSKLDLRKMYSLEELYRWAVKSDRNCFKPEDYYDVMASARHRSEACFGIELSNSAIIDLCQMEASGGSGLMGWVHGFVCRQGDRDENVVKVISDSMCVPDNELLGCFIIGAHCSIPTIRKTLAGHQQALRFVLFYSTSDGTLVSIPMRDGQILLDEQYYGEEKLEELKIWTRRRR